MELKNGTPSTFLKFAGLNNLNDPTKLSKIADVYDRLTGQKTTLPNGEVTYSIVWKAKSPDFFTVSGILSVW